MKQVSPSQEQTTSCFRRELPRLIMLDLFLKTFCEVFQKPKPTILGDPRNSLQDEHDPPTNPDQPVLSFCHFPLLHSFAYLDELGKFPTENRVHLEAT